MSELPNHLAKVAIGSPALEAVQLTKLKQLLTGLYDNNPYYRDKFSAAGVNPHKLSSLKYASDSGYEYTETNSPQLGDGSLLAEFSDGTRTSKDWKVYTVTFGPTDASISGGCSQLNSLAIQKLVSPLRRRQATKLTSPQK